jgi:hypothetical protein
MAGPFARARERFAENHPVIAAGIRAAGQEAAERIIQNPATGARPADAPVIEREVEEQVAPILANATNSEPPSQSRVITGTVPAVASALATFFTGVAALFGGLGPALALEGSSRWLSIIITLAGGVGSTGGIFALFGRLRRDLPPMTYRPWNPFSWFAPRP